MIVVGGQLQSPYGLLTLAPLKKRDSMQDNNNTVSELNSPSGLSKQWGPPYLSGDETFEKRPLSKAELIWPISASDSNFNPRNIQYIPAVEIFAFLDLDQN